jgi:hypothetical protein
VRRGRFLAVVLLAPLAIQACVSAGSAAGIPPGLREFYVPEVYESLYGAWANPAYGPPDPPAKMIIYPWGLVEWFDRADGAQSSRTGTSLIVKRWTDEAGDTWYREYRKTPDSGSDAGHVFVLARVSDNEKVLEFVIGADEWPTPLDMDPEHNSTYATYRRLE